MAMGPTIQKLSSNKLASNIDTHTNKRPLLLTPRTRFARTSCMWTGGTCWLHLMFAQQTLKQVHIQLDKEHKHFED